MRVLLPILVAAAAIAPACSSSSRDTQAPEAAPVAVAMGTADLADWASPFEAGGVVLARYSATVASRVLAPVRAVHVRPGDRVRRGQPLVELEASELSAHAARASASLGAAKQSSAAAAADLTGAEAALVLAKAVHTRVSALHADRSATRQELDEATAGLAAAEARLAAARARAAESASAIEASGAAAQAAGIASTYGVLTAPFDGVVAERMVDPGAMATPGTPLLVVEDPATFRLEVRLDASRAGVATIGRTVQISLDSGAASPTWLDGRIAEISRLDPTAHAFAVKIDLPAHPGWRSGLFGRARFTGDAKRALTVPASSIVQRGQITYVFVVSAEARAQLRPVSLGMSDGERIEVLDGLQAGERIVLTPPASLQDGSPVVAGPAVKPAPATGAGR